MLDCKRSQKISCTMFKTEIMIFNGDETYPRNITLYLLFSFNLKKSQMTLFLILFLILISKINFLKSIQNSFFEIIIQFNKTSSVSDSELINSKKAIFTSITRKMNRHQLNPMQGYGLIIQTQIYVL